MKVPLTFEPEALEEMDDAFVWYEQERAGLGEEWLRAIEERLNHIQENPESNAIVWRGIRPCLVPRFKYVIYYRLLDDRLNVIAVQHGHRNPRAWRRRT